MSTLTPAQDPADPAGACLWVKGAPETLLPRCTEAPGPWLAQAEALAGQGMRVLALARRRLDPQSLPAQAGADAVERELTLLGLVGLMDPPRPEAAAAVAECRAAGIRPVMITDDHPSTARALAQAVGIVDDPLARVLTGADLARMDDALLGARVAEVAVYARMDPAQKIRIVRALQARGEFVAMTGDGVNDAPALKAADIGVAMGLGGTDVAREASSLVLLDDHFATIVAAVREGRRIFDNIRKFIRYALTGNSGEIWVLFLAPLLGLPVPLLPIHILWVSLLIGGLCLGLQAWALQVGDTHWQSMVFTTLTLTQMAHLLAIRSETEPLWRLGLCSNRPLLAAVLLSVALQLATLYVPALQAIFHTQALDVAELGLCFAAAGLVWAVVEVEKAWRRRTAARH